MKPSRTINIHILLFSLRNHHWYHRSHLHLIIQSFKTWNLTTPIERTNSLGPTSRYVLSSCRVFGGRNRKGISAGRCKSNALGPWTCFWNRFGHCGRIEIYFESCWVTWRPCYCRKCKCEYHDLNAILFGFFSKMTLTHFPVLGFFQNSRIGVKWPQFEHDL